MVQKRDNKEMEILAHLFTRGMHIRGMEQAIKMPHATIIRKLNKMEKRDIVDYRIVGKNKEYFIKRGLKSRKMLEIMENYKFLLLLEKYPHLEPLFADILKACSSELIILFGSYAKSIPKQESDIDVYIETRDQNVKKKIEGMHSRLSVKIGGFNKDSLLIKEIIKNHVIIRGAEQFYEQIFS